MTSRSKITDDLWAKDSFPEKFSDDFWESKPRKKRPKKTRPRKSPYLWSMIVSLGLYYALNHYDLSFLSFFTPDWPKLLPWVNFTLGLGLVGNFLLLFADEGRSRSFIKLALNLASLGFLFRVFQLFPFNFALGTFDLGRPFRLAILAGLLGLGVASMVDLLKLIFNPKEL